MSMPAPAGGFDLVGLQDAITAKVKMLTAAEVFEDMVEDDEPIPMKDGKIEPYVVLRYSPIRPSYTGRSMRGPRHDEYWASVDVVAIAHKGRIARKLNIGLVGSLIGFKPDGVSPISMRTDAGDPAMFTVSSNESRPTQYVASTRLRFTVNGANVAAPTP